MTERVLRPARAPRRWAPPAAWLLALGSVAVAAAIASTVRPDLPVLRGLPQVAAWSAVALLAGGLLTGGQRVAPVAAVAVPVIAVVALIDEGGPLGSTPLLLGGAGWLCLELCASSLESRRPRRRGVDVLRRRLGTQAAVVVGGAVVGAGALSVATGITATDLALQAGGALAAVGLLALVVWLAAAPDGWRDT